MKFEIKQKISNKENIYDNFFELINDFKNNYKLKVDSLEGGTEIIYVSLGIYTIILNNPKLWDNAEFVFKTDTTKFDFDNKYNFIFSKKNKIFEKENI